MQIHLRNPLILKALIDANLAEVELVMVVASLQSTCIHDTVAECEHSAEVYGSGYNPPIRICLDCGLSEEGSSFYVLKKELVYKIPRNTLLSLRQGPFIDNVPNGWMDGREEVSDKVALARGIVTPARLIESWKVSRLASLKKIGERYDVNEDVPSPK